MRNQDMKTEGVKVQKHPAGYWFIMLAVALGLFFISSSRANATIIIKGDDDDFSKAIKECLAEYEKIGGTLGKITERLKDSKNQHIIEEGNDYSSVPSDGKKATDGTGTGSHTRVSKKNWETIKKKFDSLKSKDFCAALLHELWHAVDADMGSFDTSKKDGVKVYEFEAVLIQNIYHKAKKLAERETYGGKKVPSDVKVPDVVSLPPPSLPGTSSTTPIPTPTPTPTPPPLPPAEPPPQPPAPTVRSITYDHVVPGVYSEVYVTVVTQAGVQVQATLNGPGVSSAATQSGVANASGVASFTWRIGSYGVYSLSP